MKSIIKNGESTTNSYPCLKESAIDKGKIVVLFSEEGNGLVVYSKGSIWRVGEYCSRWSMETFRPFNGTIELSNN